MMTEHDHEMLMYMGFVKTDESVDELFWAYEVTVRNLTLCLSWSLAERSLQTRICEGSSVICVVSSEGMVSSNVSNDEINAVFRVDGADTNLIVKVSPLISVSWSTLKA